MKKKGNDYYAWFETKMQGDEHEGIDLMLYEEDVVDIYNKGKAMCDASEVVKKPYVQEQLKGRSDEFLRGVVRSCGCKDEDLKTREELEMFLVWQAAFDIVESEDAFEDR